MMIDSEAYRQRFEDSSLDELLDERESLLEFMRRYEGGDLPLELFSTTPSVQTRYFMYMEYMKELLDLIRIRMEKDDFHFKICKINSYRYFDDMIEKMDDDAKSDIMAQLKEMDGEFYDEYMEWKANSGDD